MYLGQALSSRWCLVIIVFVERKEWWYLLKHYNSNFNNTIRSIQYLKSTLIISNITRAFYPTTLQWKSQLGFTWKQYVKTHQSIWNFQEIFQRKECTVCLLACFYWMMWYQYLSIWSDHIEKQIEICICQQRVLLFLYSFSSIALNTNAGFHCILKVVWWWSPNFLNFGIIFQKENLLFTKQDEKEVVYWWIKLWRSSTIKHQKRVLQESSDLQDAKKFANGNHPTRKISLH